MKKIDLYSYFKQFNIPDNNIDIFHSLYPRKREDTLSLQDRNNSDIPVSVVEDHNDVFEAWCKLIDADLLHIDGHSDMGDAVRLQGSFDTYFPRLHIGNFICPAVHHGIVSSVYHFNPHSGKIEDYGCTYLTEDRLLLATHVNRDMGIIWGEHGSKRVISSKRIRKESLSLRVNAPFILDIDLDAFNCCRFVDHIPYHLDNMTNWEERMDKTIELLRNLKEPDLITIAQSPGWVPDMDVNSVLSRLVGLLIDVYPTPLKVTQNNRRRATSRINLLNNFKKYPFEKDDYEIINGPLAYEKTWGKK